MSPLTYIATQYTDTVADYIMFDRTQDVLMMSVCNDVYYESTIYTVV
jgi:hypothetical protein